MLRLCLWLAIGTGDQREIRTKPFENWKGKFPVNKQEEEILEHVPSKNKNKNKNKNLEWNQQSKQIFI